jgi:hypothetical protein
LAPGYIYNAGPVYDSKSSDRFSTNRLRFNITK